MEEPFLGREIKYSKEHLWVRNENELYIMGISDYAQKQMGEIIFLELPEAGKILIRGDSFGIVESAKNVADLLTPLSGEVVEVNSSIMDSPNVVNIDPYKKGWLIKLKINDSAELNLLVDEQKYKTFIEE